MLSRMFAPSISKHTFSIDDYREFTSVSENLVPSKNGLFNSPVFSYTGVSYSGESTPVKVYGDGEDTYLYSSDGKLYKIVDGALSLAVNATFDYAPTLFRVKINGKSVLIAATHLLSKRLDTGASVTYPFGDAFTVFRNILFIGNDDTISFSAPFSHSNFTVSASDGGYYKADFSLGNFRGFFYQDDILTAFFYRGAIEIKAGENQIDFSFDKLNLSDFTVYPDSLACFGDIAVFLDGKILSVYKGRKVWRVDSCLDKKYFSPVGKAGVKDGVYLLRMRVSDGANSDGTPDQNAEYKIFCYDIYSGLSYFTEDHGGISETGGFSVDASGKIYAFSTAQTLTARKFKSVKTDLGKHGVKHVTGLSLDSLCDLTLTLSNGVDEVSFSVKKGCNEFNTSLLGTVFTLDFSCTSILVEIKNVKIDFIC